MRLRPFNALLLLAALGSSLTAAPLRAAETGGPTDPAVRNDPRDDRGTNSPAPAAEPNARSAASATSAASGSPFRLEAFRLIYDRNIFNPNRTGRSPEREFTQREPERRVRTESVALVGTMSYDRGHFAFFDGSNPDHRKVVKTSETIAGLTVTTITPQQVVLQPASTNEATITLPLGMQLQRHDDGKWEVAARPDSGGSGSSSPSTSPAGGGGSDDVLKRLMQQREQDRGTAAPPADSAPAPGSNPTSTSSNPPSARPASAPVSGGAEDEILKRLMQRREKGE